MTTPMNNPAPALFTPLLIGGVEVRNRILSSAHLTNYAEDGLPSERHLAYWREKARGGIGLIITEGSLVHPSSRTPETRFIEMWSDAVVEPLARIADAVHADGAAIFAQLNHMGMGWAPSPWLRPNGMRAHEMTAAEIAELVDAFAGAARRAQLAGLDGVEVHASHGYLIEQFLSPLSNRRTDAYGGSETNRMRLLLEVLRAIREQVGEDFVVGIRISGDQFTPGGISLADMVRLVPQITAAVTLDFLNVSYYRNQDYGPAGNSIVPMYVPEGRFVYLAEAIKAVTSLPVFCVNRIVDPRMAEQIIAEGRADMVAMTRANIADPHLSRKAAEGRLDEIRPCIGVNEGCLGQVMNGSASPMTCAVNPGAGHEHAPATPAGSPRRIAVIGGGIAGLELARVAAERGHRVRLYERGARLGGQLLTAALIPRLDAMARPMAYFERQFELLGVDVELGREVTAQNAAELEADAIVVATGSRAAGWADGGLAAAPGLAWSSVRDAFGADYSGRRVLVYATDQSMEPLGLASLLAAQGADITFATPATALGAMVENGTRPFVLDELRRAGVELAVLSTLAVAADGLTTLRRGDRGDRVIPVAEEFGAVLLGFGAVADDGLYRDLEGRAAHELHVVGDAYAPRRLVAATQQAYALATAL